MSKSGFSKNYKADVYATDEDAARAYWLDALRWALRQKIYIATPDNTTQNTPFIDLDKIKAEIKAVEEGR